MPNIAEIRVLAKEMPQIAIKMFKSLFNSPLYLVNKLLCKIILNYINHNFFQSTGDTLYTLADSNFLTMLCKMSCFAFDH